jgi:sulfur-oxidizing protein SoxY
MKTRVWTVLFCLFVAAPALAEDPDGAVARDARWRDLEKAALSGRIAAPANGIVTLDAPVRAEDAALVPMTITLAETQKARQVWLIIDDNPSPVAAHYTFGPAAYPHVLKFRVRVNDYTNVHAVAELEDGSLVADVKFVKASGGCSAPMGESDEEAMKGMGQMRLKFSGGATPDAPIEAVLMVRHPNFNGMQQNQVTQLYTPARFIDRISMTYGDKKVFDLETGISLASNPVLTFGLAPHPTGLVRVEVHDSDNSVWRKTFADVPEATN